jgi:uncharacterized membrane protein
MNTVSRIAQVATFLSILGTGVMAGLFFAFSTSVMEALGKVPAPQGIAVMKAANTAILNPVFLLTFMGSAAACLAVLVLAPFDDIPGTPWRVAGALVYLIGAIVVTAAINVPMNNALDAADAASTAGAELWATYLNRWTAWNHVRTVASLAATLLLVLGFRR